MGRDVGAAPTGYTIKSANVTITVPMVTCKHSIGRASKGKLYPGWHASFWVGIDGWTWSRKSPNRTVEQAGIFASCKTRNSKATYRGFYEMFPAGPIFVKHSVRPGNVIDVYVSVKGSTYTFGAGSVSGTTYFTTKARCAKNTKCRNATAEVITEAPGGGPNAGHGLADTGTVSYVNAAVSLSGQPFGLPLADLAKLTKITLSPKGYPGLVRPSGLSERTGYSSFKTYWR